jgi:hypothetical protein
MYEQLSAFMLSFVRTRFAVLALFPVFLLIGGCGGSSHSSSSTAPSTSTSASSTAAVSSSASSTTASATSTTAHKPKHFATGSSNVRVPATFTVRSGGKLSPPQISLPAHLAVQVTVISGDGHPHRVVVMTPSPRTLSVPAGGRASVLVGGLKVGRYPIELDGTAAGLLVTGAQPGP